MVPTFRRLLPVILTIFAIYCPASPAQTLAAADPEVMRSALTAAQTSDWSRAYAGAAAIADPVALKMLRWMDYARPGAPGRFPEIAEFIERNPEWPAQKGLRKHAEEALAGETDAVAAEWFKRYPAISPTGKVREAEMMLNSGDLEGGTAALRATWIAADYGPLDEKNFLARHSASLRAEDHVQRIDRLLWEGQSEAAHRMLGILPSDYRLLAEARLAFATQAANAEAAVARVPAQLRSDPGLVFEQLRWRRKKDMTDAAVQILLAQRTDLVRPAAWWAERQSIARRILAGGNAELAYRIVEQHGLIEGNAFSDAQFLLGYIALRYMKQPALAFEHFSRILTRVGKPVPGAAELAQFSSDEVVRAARIFFELGDQAHAKVFLLDMADHAKTPAKFAMLASLAETNDRIDLAIAVAKRAIEAGTPLMVHGYPVTTVPSGGTAEHSLLFAIMRQESAFERDAVSRVGARGLMQLMPATASFIANKMQLPFSADRLTADAIYNVLLGRAYLETLIDDFGGSYALAIASYNAGPGRVRQWVRDYGDPRGGNIDMVDWIEMIPINETRNYVQRVLENLQIYRGQVGRESAFSLASDLAR